MVLNMGYNAAKDHFADPKGKENESIRTFCATKCMVTWNMEYTSAICRERCGGGSFLASSEIPNGMLGAHSGMTAEGDNRVLMQKVVKDIMTDCQKDLHRTGEMTMCPENQIPKMKSIANQETLTNLIYYREIAEIESMQNNIAQKVMQEKKKFFDVWMYEESDAIQDVASAFGERYMLENSLIALKNCSNANARLILEKVIYLHSLSLVRKE